MRQQRKKLTRAAFRAAVFKRDRNRCRVCGANMGGVDSDGKKVKLAAHHITPRTHMVGGGYVVENGITLCEGCHLVAESWYTTTNDGALVVVHGANKAYDPALLYKLVGSSFITALKACIVASR